MTSFFENPPPEVDGCGGISIFGASSGKPPPTQAFVFPISPTFIPVGEDSATIFPVWNSKYQSLTLFPLDNFVSNKASWISWGVAFGFLRLMTPTTSLSFPMSESLNPPVVPSKTVDNHFAPPIAAVFNPMERR